jgi:hypothetical protein
MKATVTIWPSQTFNRSLIIFSACLKIVFLLNGPLHAQSSSERFSEIVLYDASPGTDPDQQGWIFLSSTFSQSQTVRFTENGIHTFSTLANLSESAGYFGNQHPRIDLLSAENGFAVEIELQILDEQHQSENRGGFNIIILSDDGTGVELAFWEDSVWVYNTQFEIEERAEYNTTDRLTRYRIEFANRQYFIFADDQPLFSGPLRDYSPSGIPYSYKNFIFFGDDTSSAGAEVNISRIVLLSEMKPKSDEHFTYLFQNYPNPFEQNTLIRFWLEDNEFVQLDVFDLNGKRIATLANGPYEHGNHEVSFDGSGLSGGMYIYRLRTNSQILSKKLMLIK